MHKVAVYDPYLDTLGGGERYLLTIAEILQNHGYNVDIFWSGDQDILSKAESRFNLNLKNLNLVPDIFFNKQSSKNNINNHNIFQKLSCFINKFKITRQYDLIFYISDWSVPFLFAKNNFLHVQVPFSSTGKLSESFLNRIKLLNYKTIVCNSKFTQKFVQKKFGNKNTTLYPPVDVEKFINNSIKQDIILSVGRFDSNLNSKKQDVLIEAFKRLIEYHPHQNWRLVLAGGSLGDSTKNSYIKHLKFISNNLPVEIIINPQFERLQQIFSVSKIYWHAAGYNVDQNVHPENTEHFGITVVEAMASGLVPIIINRGGLPEIIREDYNGYLWDSIDTLVSKTRILIDNPQKLQSLSSQAVKDCHQFSKSVFESKLLEIINK